MTTQVLVATLIVLVSHWVADFVCQTHWQATNKSSDNVALTRHVGSYTLVMIPGAALLSFVGVLSAGAPVLLWIGLNAVLHWCTDYVTSRQTKRLWADGRVHDFFVVVGLDQLIHYATLFATLYVFWEV